MISSGLRERKKRQTRRAIASSALDLALTLGLDDVTTERIVTAAGVSTRTFSNYFSCKEEAVVAGHAEEATEVFLDLLHARPAEEPPRAALREALRTSLPRCGSPQADRLLQIMQLFRSNSALSGFHFSTYARAEEETAKFVAERSESDLAEDPYPWVLASSAITGYRVAVDRWSHVPDSDLRLLLDQILDAMWTDLDRTVPHGTQDATKTLSV